MHGLSVAATLARRLGKVGPQPQVVLVERATLGAGATGIAGGIVRGYYRSPAITEIVRMSVERFERTPAEFGFRSARTRRLTPTGRRNPAHVAGEAFASSGPYPWT